MTLLRPEYLVIFFMIICSCMSLFNFFFVFQEKRKTKKLDRLAKKMAQSLSSEIERNAEFPTPEHRRKLLRELKSLAGLETFNSIMARMQQDYPQKSAHYLHGIAIVFEDLCGHYSAKDSLNRAYFAYVVRHWYRPPISEIPEISKTPEGAAHHERNPVVSLMLALLLDDSFYTRENALEAIAAVGSASDFAQALIILETSASHTENLNARLITEAALSFHGNKQELSDRLRAVKHTLSPEAEGAILNFMRMTDTAIPENVLRNLANPATDKETRIGCARYFMTHQDVRALPILCKLAQDEDPAHWEITSVCAAALGSYNTAESVTALKVALHSRTWYVRYNAAHSLFQLGVNPKTTLADVMHDHDRYAREMITYRWQIEGKEGELP